MIDHRGPQLVQLVNGYPRRRSSGEKISSMHARQVARSAGRVGRTAANALARTDRKGILDGRQTGQFGHHDRVDPGLRRRGVAQLRQERRHLGRIALDLDPHRVGLVPDPAAKPLLLGGNVEERSKPHPLDHPPNLNRHTTLTARGYFGGCE